MSAADAAYALGDARREGRTWRPLRRLRRASAIKNYLARVNRTSPPRRQGCERRAKGADRGQTTGGRRAKHGGINYAPVFTIAGWEY
jgi:hypothetical protein